MPTPDLLRVEEHPLFGVIELQHYICEHLDSASRTRLAGVAGGFEDVSLTQLYRELREPWVLLRFICVEPVLREVGEWDEERETGFSVIDDEAYHNLTDTFARMEAYASLVRNVVFDEGAIGCLQCTVMAFKKYTSLRNTALLPKVLTAEVTCTSDAGLGLLSCLSDDVELRLVYGPSVSQDAIDQAAHRFKRATFAGQ
ncbi:unnamed protein product [Somion occarium]|uniref:Uncharacterized protein n=1 Tax=Somion occarium TaxID=3059160 RepID=A0ABP1D2Q8_9APHY